MADLAIQRRETRFPVLVGLILASVGVHFGAFGLLTSLERPVAPTKSNPLELVVIEIQKKEPEPEPPKVEEPIEVVKPVVKPKPPPVKVAVTTKAPPPPIDAPPPPNDTPPPETPTKPAPLVVGMSFSSTTSSGSFAAPVGNTLYGKTADKATAPKDVQQYAAPKYVPIYQVDSEPMVASEVKVPYPPEAKKAGIEGTVRLKIEIDHEGRVGGVKLVSGLGYGLDEAAISAVKKFAWRPATRKGEPVSTTLTYAYTFILD